jgi:hypothetical protein
MSAPGRIREHLKRNAYGLVAVFIALGGGAYAATKVGPNDIATNAVHSRHIKAGNVKPADQGFVPAARYQDPRTANCGGVSVPGTGQDTTIEWGQTAFRFGGVKASACPPSGQLRDGLIAPRDGLYAIEAGVIWPANLSGNFREMTVEANGDPVADDVTKPGDNPRQTAAALADLRKGNRVKLVVSADASTPLQLENTGETFLSFHWVGPDHIGPVD